MRWSPVRRPLRRRRGRLVPVQTAEEMREAVLHHRRTTIVVEAAAVAAYRASRPRPPRSRQARPRSRAAEPDILAEVAAASGTFVVGFAAGLTTSPRMPARSSRSKGIDLLVANDIEAQGISFDAEDNEVLLVDRWAYRGATADEDRGLRRSLAVLALRAGAGVGRPPRRWRPSTRAQLADALGALGETLRHHRDLGFTELSLPPTICSTLHSGPGESSPELPQVQALRGRDGRVRSGNPR